MLQKTFDALDTALCEQGAKLLVAANAALRVNDASDAATKNGRNAKLEAMPASSLSITKNGWLAACPSGTSDIDKIRVERFPGEAHLTHIVD
jgi:phosphoglucomutase